MSFSQLARWWDSRRPRLGTRQRRAGGRAKPRASFRPQVQGLEDRCLLCTVTSLSDSGPGSLRQCIADTPTTGTVDFDKGLSGTITLTSAPLAINKFLTIAGPGDSVITISGNHARQVFNIPAPWSVTISGLTIANGNSGSVGGGGISNGGALMLTDCVLSSNTSQGGGGIYNTGNLTITNSIISGNSATYFGGGGIQNSAGTLIVTGSTISGNSATDDNGAGLENLANATITNSVFSNNSQTRSGYNGGAIYNSGTLTLTNTTLNGNRTVTAGGGISNSGTLTVSNSTFSGNSAASNGGGISNSGTLTVSNSTFSGNSAASNGGGINNGNSSTNVTVANSTFNLNAAVNGAGIAHTGNGTLTLTSSTLSGNIASNQGGGIFHSGTGRMMTLNTIIAGNRAFMPSVDVSGALGSQGYNLIGNGTGGTGYTDTDLVGTADTPIDPLLGPLDDYGGPTKTMAVLPGSPALNAGDPDLLDSASDQRGVLRSGGVNIGAFQASAAFFDVAAPDTAEAGTPFDVTVAAFDPYKQPAVGYTGTVTFSSADPYGAGLPADYTFTTDDQGTVTFAAGAALYTAGTWDVTATDSDSGITGSASVTVTPALAVAFQVIAPSSGASGAPFDVTVIAVDPYGNTDTNYQGTVTFSTSDPDPGVVLPADYTFQTGDAGIATFAGGVTLITVGDQTITATDVDSGISGSTTVTVTAPGPGRSDGGRHVRDLLVTMQEPSLLGSATSGRSRLESADINQDLPARREAGRSVAVLSARAMDLGNGPALILPAGAVDGVFAKADLDLALLRPLGGSADWAEAN